MSIIVQKYGGTSVGNIEKIKNVAKRVIDTKNQGNKVIVVVSAMGDTTDDLMTKAYGLNEKPSSRELDMLLSTGEQITIALLAIAIESENEKVISLTGGMSGIMTDQEFSKARIADINPSKVLAELDDGKIVIVAGFQGVTEDGSITTLGRGGSDTTAVALAAATKASKCEIYTDVDGVYTTDPRIVKEARFLPEVSFDEMLELAHLGAGVLHPRSVELAAKYEVPLVVRSSFNFDCPGTKLVEVDKMEKVLVRGISLDKNIARVSVSNVFDKPGIAFGLFSKLAGDNISVDMIIQNLNHDDLNDISFTVSKDDLAKTVKVCNEYLSSMGDSSKVLTKDTVCKISIVGTGISGNTEVASKLFETLFNLGINIEMISTSEIKISCIIDSQKSEDALRGIHAAFELDKLNIER
jgi:aspartate kinase